MYKRIIDDFWSFRNADTKEYTHCYHNYPAMMIPQIARKLLCDYAPSGKMSLVFDPYMGSGTTLVESSILGVNSIGTDLNPLACFIAKVKTTHYDYCSVTTSFNQIIEKIKNFSIDKVVNTDFSRISNYTFWYTIDNLYKLSYLNQIIDAIRDEIRDFFLVCLSETVREVSFTRNGEFKRYKMSTKQLENFDPDVFEIFQKKVERNIVGLQAYNNINKNTLTSIYNFNSSINVPNDIIPNGCVDMVVTSPPYGDSHTTVAYGQFSRWANEWFGFANAKKIDKLLMGGVVTKKILFQTNSIKEELSEINKIDERRFYEVTSFLNDYWASIQNVSNLLRKGGRVCYVVGNRRVKGIQINLDYFTAEMFEKCGFKHEITLVREIPNKRMPSKTSPTNVAGAKVSTMSNEYIVILTKY